jgi:hypothetical protein
MVTGTQMQTAWALGIRDLAETLETCLAEVKHKRELKLQHPEPLAVEGFSTSQHTERTGGPPPTHQPAMALSHQSASLLPHRSAKLPSAGLPGHHPLTSPLAHQMLTPTGRLQQHQMPAPNLPRRCWQTGLDAKGVTPELLRLKFYCSWTEDFFLFIFLFLKYLSCSLFVHHLPVDFFSSLFFSFFFLLLSWFC